ncbi:hypothetical protein, partial [Serratia marcescens]|uniref:hypothetical protein n=1 Tax=Serratia marcescens TaxID=615 RepID=UPI001C376AD2
SIPHPSWPHIACFIVFAPESSIGNTAGFTTRLAHRKKWRNRPSPLEKNVNCSNLYTVRQHNSDSG